MHKKILIRKIEDLFDTIARHPWYQRVHGLPRWIKWIISACLVIIGVLGAIIPILPGAIFICMAIILITGIHRARRTSLRLIYQNKLHILFSRIYSWWKYRK